MKVLVFGDSITQGYWDTGGGWVERLRRHYYSVIMKDFDGPDIPLVFNLGIVGNNSQEILKRLEPETIARTWEDLPIIIVQVGINDSSTDTLSRGISVSVPIDAYEHNLRQIIEKAAPISTKLIFVGLSACDETRTTPVPWGNYYYTNQAIKNYENTMKSIAAEKNIPFIPVFDNFKAELDTGRDLLTDGLHPNNDGHVLLCEIIKSQLAPLLSK